MPDTYSVPLTTLVREFHLEPAFLSTDYESIHLTVEDVARPGLQLAGYFDHFEPMRLQLMGNVEVSFVERFTPAERLVIFDRFFSYKPPALIMARNLPPDPQCLEMAKKHNVTVLRSHRATSTVASTIITYLRAALAPRITRHGVLVDVNGEGVLLMGESGVGKSETAVELVKRGHRLVADDAVEIRHIGTQLIGSAPNIIRHYMELRGIGVINVRHIYGVGAVKLDTDIDLVVQMENWEPGKMYDRLGVVNETTEFMGVCIPKVTIPISPGRNLAVIMELAAMNNRQKKLGYNAAETLEAEINAAIEAGIEF